MAAKIRFMTTKAGKVHVVTTPANDKKTSGCRVVKAGHTTGSWKGKRGISPEAALALDDCADCVTHLEAQRVINVNKSPEQKRAEANERRDEVLERAKGKSTKRAKGADYRKGRKPTGGGSQRKVERKAPSMTKSGPRSVASSGSGDAGEEKAKMLIQFGDEHGWSSTLDKDGPTGWVVTSIRDDETIYTWYVDGKYDINHHAEVHVGSWVGKLRGAHAARRQMSMEGRDRPYPEPGKGRSGPRKSTKSEPEPPEDESPEDARRRVPFLLDDDEADILDVVRGKTIRWRNSISGTTEEAVVSAKARIVVHPKSQDRMLDFHELAGYTEDHGEVLGPNRVVRLSRVLRVIG